MRQAPHPNKNPATMRKYPLPRGQPPPDWLGLAPSPWQTGKATQHQTHSNH